MRLKKHKDKLLMGGLALVLLIAVYWYGGSAPGMQGWTVEDAPAQTQQVPEGEETTESLPVEVPQEEPEPQADLDSRPGGTEGSMTAQEKEEAAKELADLLGGVVACTRPLVEGNIFDAKHQIGLSGRTVKPKLIITLGISGAVQFAAGMKGSDCIVAINSDPNAPIFDVAHYCVVGDVNLIVPKLIEKIKGVS